MKTLFVLLDKEIRQFFRNAFLPKLVIVFPVMVILIIPWVTTMDVRHIGVSVVDNDHSETSRRIIQKIEASDYFNLRGVTESYDDSFALLEGGEADVILTIPNDFELSLIGDSPKRIGIDVNGINAMKGGTWLTVYGTARHADFRRITAREIGRCISRFVYGAESV